MGIEILAAFGLGLGLLGAQRKRNSGTWAPTSDSNLLAWFHGGDLSDGAVSSWTSRGNGGTVVQGTAAAQPTASSGVVSFDGSNDQLAGRNYPRLTAPTVVTTQKVPDATYGGVVAGNGFTNTGLCPDGSGGWWAGNSVAAGPNEPSLVHLSSNFSTKSGEIRLSTLYTGILGVQGLTLDTSDNSIWFADTVNKKIQHITQAGSDVADGFALSGAKTPTGVAYNSSHDSVYVNNTSNTNIEEYSCVDGSLLRTYDYNIGNLSVEQLWYDNTNGILWISYGDNSASGHLTGIKITTNCIVADYLLTESTTIEGFYIDSAISRLYVCNDGFFHSDSDGRNRVTTYALTYPTTPFGQKNVVDFFYVGKFATAPASTKVIMALGQPTITTPVPQCGGSYFAGTSGPGLRLAGTTQDQTTLHGPTNGNSGATPALTSDCILYGRIDTDGDLISLWMNGTAYATTSVAGLDNNFIGSGNVMVIGAVNNGNFADLRLRDVGAFIGAGDRQKVEGWAAWQYSLQSVLPSDHPYKNAAP